MAIYDKNMFLQGVAVGLALGRKAYDYFWKKSSTTPVTDNIFLERQKIAEYNNITSHDICSRHKNFGVSPDKFYVAFVSQGKAYVASTTPKKKLSWQVWEEEQFVRNATDVAIEFDGKFIKNGGKEEFITNDEPHIFWVTPEGSLKCSILGLLGETLLASENCTKVTAIRAICDNYSFDYGLVVFFIDAGKIYYRQLIHGNWTDAEQVSFGGNQYWIDISAFRTQDYRIVLQAKNINGEVYELYSQFMGIGKHGTEHLQIDNITVTSVLTEILYKNFKSSDEHLNITSAMWGALYGGLYDARTPSIVNAYNIEDQNEDWGTTAIFVFDKHLVAAEVAAQYTAFSIVDSRNVTFTATSATLGSDGKTVTLTFLDYNNANGVCAAKYTPGTVTSMAGTTLVATSFNWTPQNLVPSLIPVPEVYSIVNVGITDIGYNRVRFYDTTGETLLYTEYVHDGDDCEYGTNEVWAITANSGTIAVDITENVENSMDLYLARWRVRYYSKDGQTLSYTEYVVDGEDAEWGAGQDWSDVAEGEAVSGILENINANIDVYNCVSFWARVDSYVYDANTTMLTHSGSRQPAIKTNNGEAAGIFCYNCGGSSYGGNWFAFYLIGKTAADCAYSCQTSGTGSFSYNGHTYYYTFVAMSPSWGGAASYNNPVGFPEMHDVQTFVVNGALLTSSGAQAIAQVLQLGW